MLPECRGRPTRQRGLASVEFAISAAVIATLLLLAAEVGRLVYTYATLEQAVRNGSRYASANGLSAARTPQEDVIRPTVQNLVVTGTPAGTGAAVLDGFTIESVSLEPSAASTIGEDYMDIVATYEYVPLFSSIPIALTGNTAEFGFTMTASDTVRALP